MGKVWMKLNFVIAIPRLKTLGAVIFSLEIIPRWFCTTTLYPESVA